MPKSQIEAWKHEGSHHRDLVRQKLKEDREKKEKEEKDRKNCLILGLANLGPTKDSAHEGDGSPSEAKTSDMNID